jgi:CheY-like chemotaxis protein
MARMAHETALVVEDEPLTRLDAAETLREAGFEVLEADDAAGALELIEERDDIALLFTDINMPGAVDGCELARRAHEMHPAMRLILTSGEVRPAEEDIPDAGIFLAKPYSPAAVTAAVARLMAWRRPANGARRHFLR